MTTAAEPENEQSVIPIIFDHCKSVYEAMMDNSIDVFVQDENDDAVELVVYKGHLTKLFQDLRLSVPYYTQVTRELKRMGCIRQLRRGGGNAESEWELIQPPTEELWRATTPTKRRERHADWREQTDQAIRNLVSRINDLETALEVHAHV